MLDVYAPGLVVVPRYYRAEGRNGRPGRPREGWTRHREGCRHAARAADVLPAPAQAYPDTVDCYECQPGSDHRTSLVEVGGRWLAGCEGCELTGVGGTRRSAEVALARLHDQARAGAALAAARAAAPDEDLVVLVPRSHAIEASPGVRVWTRHLQSCTFARRAKIAWPAGEISPPHVVDCVYCAPSSDHRETYEPTPAGKVRGRCACGLDAGDRPSENAARWKLRRLHDAR